jgi:hypothetical protein
MKQIIPMKKKHSTPMPRKKNTPHQCTLEGYFKKTQNPLANIYSIYVYNISGHNQSCAYELRLPVDMN